MSLMEDARNPDGRKRFYPPGSHPALARYKAQIKAMEKLRADGVRKSIEQGWVFDTSAIDEALAYCKDQVALFEGGESEAKMYYYERTKDQDR